MDFNIQNLIDAIEPFDGQAAHDMQMIIDNLEPLPRYTIKELENDAE